MSGQDGAMHSHWHEMFDALCVEHGHLDNFRLAEQFCAATGNGTQAAFDAAVKNLRNWRSGIHIPQRRNFLLLGRLLGVERRPDMREEWNRLYGQARHVSAEAVDEIADVPVPIATPAPAHPSSRWRGPAFFALTAVVIAIAMAAGTALWLTGGETADPVASYEGVVAEYVRNVSLKVGESAIIHGARGDECGPAPSWDVAEDMLPELVTGTLTDGGVGTRNSRQCGGRVPARAILFTATTAGTEQTSLYGDDIVIRVSR